MLLAAIKSIRLSGAVASYNNNNNNYSARPVQKIPISEPTAPVQQQFKLQSSHYLRHNSNILVVERNWTGFCWLKLRVTTSFKGAKDGPRTKAFSFAPLWRGLALWSATFASSSFGTLTDPSVSYLKPNSNAQPTLSPPIVMVSIFVSIGIAKHWQQPPNP